MIIVADVECFQRGEWRVASGEGRVVRGEGRVTSDVIPVYAGIRSVWAGSGNVVWLTIPQSRGRREKTMDSRLKLRE